MYGEFPQHLQCTHTQCLLVRVSNRFSLFVRLRVITKKIAYIYAYGSAECVQVVYHSSSTLLISCNANLKKLHDASNRAFCSAISQTDRRRERSRAGSRRFRSRSCRRTHGAELFRRPGCWPRASERNVRCRQNTRFMYPAAARGIETRPGRFTASILLKLVLYQRTFFRLTSSGV